MANSFFESSFVLIHVQKSNIRKHNKQIQRKICQNNFPYKGRMEDPFLMQENTAQKKFRVLYVLCSEIQHPSDNQRII